MKLVLYDENRILSVFEDIRSPSVDENNLEWEGGSLSGASLFLLLEDAVDLSAGLTAEIIALDQKNNFLKQAPVDINSRLQSLEDAVLFLMG